jgi:hypothetical protein
MLSIRKKLVEAMELDTATEALLPARFLLALEREVHVPVEENCVIVPSS